MNEKVETLVTLASFGLMGKTKLGRHQIFQFKTIQFHIRATGFVNQSGAGHANVIFFVFLQFKKPVILTLNESEYL